MINPEESVIDFKKYLRKILSLIDKEAIFSWFDIRFLDKNRIDDLLCCLEASWPEDYKNYISKYSTSRVQSTKNLRRLKGIVTNKFFMNNSVYLIRYSEAQLAISQLLQSIDSDMKNICRSQYDNF